MSARMDAIVILDCESSMTVEFDGVRRLITDCTAPIFDMAAHNRIGLIEFRSVHDLVVGHGFTNDRNRFQVWLNSSQPDGAGPDGRKALGEAMKMALDFPWRENNNGDIPYEKLVILFTDGAPNGLLDQIVGDDPWKLSNKFEKENITLFVAGVEPTILPCDDFYCALAKNTGGEYIPMINFGHIFVNVLNAVFNDDDTINQVLKHVPQDEIEQGSSFVYRYMERRVQGMIYECSTMADIKKEFYNFRTVPVNE